jgi:hypothetical protein
MRIKAWFLIIVFCCSSLCSLAATSTALAIKNSQDASLNSGSADKQQGSTYVFVLGFLAKLVLDGVAFQQELEQRQDILAVPLEYNQTIVCSGVCQSNTDHFVKGLKSAKIAAIFSGFFLATSIVSDIWGGFSSCPGGKKNNMEVAAIISAGLSGLSFIALLATNGYLWNLSLWHEQGVPQDTVSALSVAMNSGIYPLIAAGIIGLPCACVLCVMSASADT